MSPRLGVLDEQAFARQLDADPDAALELLAELTGATDVRLRALARQLAGRVVIRLGRAGPARAPGVGTLHRVRLRPGADLDLDASLDALVPTLSGAAPVAADELVGAVWARRRTAVCLLVDRSGSMRGSRLATAALAAAAVALRAPDDHSVLAFGRDVVVVKGQHEARATHAVVDDLLALRGHGTTDLALALRAARRQLATSSAARKITVVLSDCRVTKGEDPLDQARQLEEIYVVGPAEDLEIARAFARSTGGRCRGLRGPSGVPAALDGLAD